MQKLLNFQNRGRNRQKGFSLLELMVVIAIAAIIAGIATPAFLSMRERYKLRAAATDVRSAIKKAQSEALMRKSSVAIIFGSGSYTCFVDDGAGVAANAKNMIRDAGEAVLFTTTLPTGISLSKNPPSFNIEFNSAGLPVATGSIDIIRGAGFATQYKVAINIAGRVVLQ